MTSHAFRFAAATIAVAIVTLSGLAAPACADEGAAGSWNRNPNGSSDGGRHYPIGDPGVDDCTSPWFAPTEPAATDAKCAASSGDGPFAQAQVVPRRPLRLHATPPVPDF